MSTDDKDPWAALDQSANQTTQTHSEADGLGQDDHDYLGDEHAHNPSNHEGEEGDESADTKPEPRKKSKVIPLVAIAVILVGVFYGAYRLVGPILGLKPSAPVVDQNAIVMSPSGTGTDTVPAATQSGAPGVPLSEAVPAASNAPGVTDAVTPNVTNTAPPAVPPASSPVAATTPQTNAQAIAQAAQIESLTAQVKRLEELLALEKASAKPTANEPAKACVKEPSAAQAKVVHTPSVKKPKSPSVAAVSTEAPAKPKTAGTSKVAKNSAQKKPGKETQAASAPAPELLTEYTLMSIAPRSGGFQQAWIKHKTTGTTFVVAPGDTFAGIEVTKVDYTAFEVMTKAGVIR